MEALEIDYKQFGCQEETLNFIGDLVELVGHYERAVVNLQNKNSNTDKEAQELRLQLAEAISNAKSAEDQTAEAIFAAITSMFKELSLSEEKSDDLDMSNQSISPSVQELIVDKISAYKTQLREEARTMKQELDSVSSKYRDLEQHVAEVSTTLRTLGEQLVSLIARDSSMTSLTFSMDDGATLSTMLTDFAGAVQAVSEHTAQTSARLLQAESELLFYKAQAGTRADSEQKALESLSSQTAENEKLKKENGDALNLISDLQMGLYAKNSEIVELQKELRSLADTLKVEEAKTANLNKELLATQKTLSDVQANLLTEQSRISAMSTIPLQLEQAHEDLRNAELTAARLRAEHQDMEKAMAAQTDTIRQLNIALSDALEDKSKLDMQIREDAVTRQGAAQELCMKVDDLSSQNTELQARVAALEQELEENTRRSAENLKAAESRTEQTLLETKAMSERIVQLEEIEHILTENLKECEIELARVNEANIALQTDIVEMSQEKEQMKEQSSANERLVGERLEQTEQTMIEMATEMDSLKQQIENLTADIHVREEMIANCEEEIGRLDALSVATAEELQKVRHQKANLEDELAQKELQVEKANTNLVNATSDMQTALKSAENAFTDRYLKALEDLKVARASSVELEERLANLRSELQSAHLRLDEKDAEMEALQLQNEALLKEKTATIDKLQSSLVHRDDSANVLSSQNDRLVANLQELGTRIRELEGELDAKTRTVAEQGEKLQLLLANGSDLQNNQISEQATLLTQKDAKISALRGDLSNVEHRLSDLADVASGILDLLAELAEDSSQSMVELSKVGSRSVSRAASATEPLALSTLSTAKSMGLSRLVGETIMQQKESEAALAIERAARLEAAITSIRESILSIITLTKQRLEEVAMLQERISVKEKEVNLLLDLTKSREDRINVLLEEISSKGATISEQSDVIDKMMKDLQTLRGTL